jgi:hypothetical protein
MMDEKDFRDKPTASQINPLEASFSFIIPRQLLPTHCKCDSPGQHHLELPPSMGDWGDADDMSPSM